MTLLQHISPEENMNRWYFLAIQPTLFDACAVVIAWGRRDNEFQQWRAIPAASDEQARQMVEKIVQQKLRRGYQLIR
ncbi:MAG TPA: WGR domain-containing protein [Anaerolineaceae bacterium]|nr:WGR domain-containing protein [Anaerolineaceae bacterium]HQH87036.1 WGR domain-containing protein [Anaerolineaceae bacterium]